MKKYFTVKLEALMPVEISYRIFAEDEKEAMEIVEKNPTRELMGQPKLKWVGLRKIKAAVYKLGTINKLFSKSY